MCTTLARKAYPSDASDEQWVADCPHITLIRRRGLSGARPPTAETARLKRLVADGREATGADGSSLLYVDQGYAGETAAKPPPQEASPSKSLCNTLPSAGQDHERYAETLAGLDVVAFVGYMLKHAAALAQSA